MRIYSGDAANLFGQLGLLSRDGKGSADVENEFKMRLYAALLDVLRGFNLLLKEEVRYDKGRL